MPESTALPKDAPLMVAWEAFKATDDYANTHKWARTPRVEDHDDGSLVMTWPHTEGSLWGAFMAGYFAALGWVAVTERYPNDGDMVFVFNGEVCTVANYEADAEGGEHTWTDRIQGCADLDDAPVTHWKPLPTPQDAHGRPIG